LDWHEISKPRIESAAWSEKSARINPQKKVTKIFLGDSKNDLSFGKGKWTGGIPKSAAGPNARSSGS